MPPQRRQYSQENLQNALKFIQNKEGSVRAAAKKFGVPRSTLQFKYENPDIKPKSGPDPVLSEFEEQELCKFVIELAKRGFPLKKDDLLDCVQDYLKKNPRTNPFRNNRPGDTWFKSFLKRNPNISSRTSEGVTNASSCVSEQDIRKWFSEISHYFVEDGIVDVINDPTRIFNADETGFNICPKSGKVLAEKGCRNVYQIQKAPAKENITVMFTFSASGQVCNPLIIYPYKRIPDKVSLSVPSGWGIGRSDSGWMTAAVFHDFIANCFYKELVEKNIKLPVILFVDGHKTHITIEVSELCRSLQIHLIALYPNATRILQPADVAAFRPIKVRWKKALHEWYAEHNHQISMTKEKFAPLLKKVVAACAKPETLVNGFRVCGLYPFEPNNVDYSKCIANAANSNTTTTSSSPALQDPQVNLSYEDFCNTVGMSTIVKCQSISEGRVDIHLVSDDFIIIYKLWRKIAGLGEYSATLNRSCTDDSPFQTYEAAVMDYDWQDNVLILDEQTGELKQNIVNQVREESYLSELNDTILNTINTNTEPGPSRQIHPDKLITVISNEPLSQYLKNRMPDSPKRQGKRQTEKLPFALTSDVYVEKLKIKQLKKQEEEEAKEQRKKIREEKKTQKENTIPKKKAKLTKTKDNNINESRSQSYNKIMCCDSCLCPITKRVIECNQCFNKYHVNCVPSSHRVHVPEDDDDHFLCHLCYRESNTTDSSDGDVDNMFATFCEEVKKEGY